LLHCLPSPLLGPDETYRKADGAVDSSVASRQWKLAFPVQEADGTHQVEWSMKALSNVNQFLVEHLSKGKEVIPLLEERDTQW